MNIRNRIGLVCVGVLVAVFATGFTSLNTQPTTQSHRQQLTKLNPDDLESYFIAGELLGAQAETDLERLLASQVLSIGIGLAQRQDDLSLVASMCIALASLEPDAEMSSALWDFALMLDPDRRSAWLIYRNTRRDEQAELSQESALCLYAARFHDHKVASALWERRDVRQAIGDAAQQAGVDQSRFNRSIAAMIEQASDDDCRGRVFIAHRSDGKMQRVVCPDHIRPIGTAMRDQSLQQIIKVERVLLNLEPSQPDGDGWEVNAYLELNDPAREPSFAMIRDQYRVDLSKPYWRNNRWVASP